MTGRRKVFVGYEEAKQLLVDYFLEFNNSLDYINSYKEVDSRLPRTPKKTYKDEWLGWDDFLGKTSV